MKNNMNLRSSLILIVFFAFNLLVTSCNKDRGVLYKRIKEGKTIELGVVIPEIGGKRNDTLSMALYPNARWFFMDLGLSQNKQNLNLVRKAIQDDVPVRAKVFEDNSSEIAEIYPASQTEIDQYRKSKVK